MFPTSTHVLQRLFSPGPVTTRAFAVPLDWLCFGLCLLAGGVVAYFLQSQGLMLYMVDQYSHLSIGRQITDSLTPGMSQVGFWPPLLHVLLAPLAFFDVLFYSGYAGALLLVPTLGVGLVLFARALYVITGVAWVSYVVAVSLLLNPYVLYFAVTPMMEILFLTLLFAVVYCFVRWWRWGELGALVGLGVTVALASLARFEGFILLPVVVAAILYREYRRKASWTEMEAHLTMFGIPALTGVGFTLVYSLVYGGSIFTFLNNSWGAQAQQQTLDLPAAGDLLVSIGYLGTAAELIFGSAFVVIALVCLVSLIGALRFARALSLIVLLLLASPFLFDILAMYQGSAVVYLPGLPPYEERYFNVRYGLLTAGVFSAAFAMAAARLYSFGSSGVRGMALPIILPTMLLSLLVSAHVQHAQVVLGEESYPVVRHSIQQIPPGQNAAAVALREEYDGGLVLMTRALHNQLIVEARLPLSSYILEANEHYFDQAIASPWWYADYIVMLNTTAGAHSEWRRENDAVSHRWGNDQATLSEYYSLIHESPTQMVYELNEEAVRAKARTYGIAEVAVPSLGTARERWDVATTQAAFNAAVNGVETAIQTN